MERLIGHVMFVFLTRRELLSVFSACYSYVRSNYNMRRRVALRGERGRRRGRLAAVRCAAAVLRRKVDTDVMMTDASPAVGGIMTGRCDEDEMRAVASVSERW